MGTSPRLPPCARPVPPPPGSETVGHTRSHISDTSQNDRDLPRRPNPVSPRPCAQHAFPEPTSPPPLHLPRHTPTPTERKKKPLGSSSPHAITHTHTHTHARTRARTRARTHACRTMEVKNVLEHHDAVPRVLTPSPALSLSRALVLISLLLVPEHRLLHTYSSIDKVTLVYHFMNVRYIILEILY